MRLALVALLVCPAGLSADEPVPKYKNRPLAYWMERLEKADTDADRGEAVAAVKAFGADAAPAVPKLLEMLADHSDGYRHQVVEMLKAVGPAAKGAVPELVRLLKEKKARDPRNVLAVLEAIGPGAMEAVPVLVPLLEDPDLATWAFAAVYTIKPPAREVLPTVRRILRDPEHGFDVAAFGKAFGADAVPLLVELLDRDGDNPRWHQKLSWWAEAADALGAIGPAAKPAADKLLPRLGDPDPEVRLTAARAVWRITKNEAVVPVLAELASVLHKWLYPAPDEPRDSTTFPVILSPPSEWRPRVEAAEMLGEIGPAAVAALPALEGVHPGWSRTWEASRAAIRKITAGKR